MYFILLILQHKELLVYFTTKDYKKISEIMFLFFIPTFCEGNKNQQTLIIFYGAPTCKFTDWTYKVLGSNLAMSLYFSFQGFITGIHVELLCS